jgi:Fe-S oxidoreductase
MDQSIAEKYDLFGCFQCGKCSAGCPVSLKSALNIRRLVRELTVRRDPKPIYERKELWDCTTCSTCSLRCPRGLKPHEVIIGLRSALVEEGNIPVTARDALEGTFKHGNPWGRIRTKRSEWAADLEVKNFSRGDKAEMLYFVGCAPSYDPRVQEVARALVKILTQAGVDFGILGNEESCCGNEIRRMGEEGLFEMLKEDNLGLFHRYAVSQIVTTSPHCYNVFKNEYQDNSFEVRHYTQLLAELIEEERIAFSKAIGRRVAYQDPCFLGKQNGVFDEPRLILRSIPGIDLVEFERSKERSLCCEGGGGRMWVEASDSGERLAAMRVREASQLGVEVLATACPFCLLNLEDAIKTQGLEGKLQVKDIAELVWEAT